MLERGVRSHPPEPLHTVFTIRELVSIIVGSEQLVAAAKSHLQKYHIATGEGREDGKRGRGGREEGREREGGGRREKGVYLTKKCQSLIFRWSGEAVVCALRAHISEV